MRLRASGRPGRVGTPRVDTRRKVSPRATRPNAAGWRSHTTPTRQLPPQPPGGYPPQGQPGGYPPQGQPGGYAGQPGGYPPQGGYNPQGGSRRRRPTQAALGVSAARLGRWRMPAWGLTGIGHPEIIIRLLGERPAPAAVQCIANLLDSPGGLKFFDEPRGRAR